MEEKTKTKLTCMTFLCIVEFIQEQNGSSYVSSIIRQCKCPSPSRKIVGVQKFGCHVNVTSHFSLFSYLWTLQSWWKPKKTADFSRHHCRVFSQASRDVKKCYLQTLSTQESRGIQTVLSKLRDATASTSGRLYNWSTSCIDPSKHVVFFQLLKRTSYPDNLSPALETFQAL